jgi:PEGA domain
VTPAVPTATTPPPGTNSVFFETWPPGATIFLDGENVGTTPFTYYTNRKGTFDVLVRQDGYEKYEAKVTILEGRLVHFTAPLTVYSPTPATVTTTTSPTTAKTTIPVTTTATPGTNVTTSGTTPGAPATNTTTPQKPPVTFRNSSITIPTPWATDPPVAEKSPFDPVLAPGAVVLGIVVVALAVIVKKREGYL